MRSSHNGEARWSTRRNVPVLRACSADHSGVGMRDSRASTIAFSIPLPACWGKRRMEGAREASRCIPQPYAFERVLDEDGAETLSCGWRDRRAVLLLPRKHQAIAAHRFPSDADAARPIGERTIFSRVGCQLMQREGDVQRNAGVQPQLRPFESEAVALKRLDCCLNHRGQGSTIPAVSDEQIMSFAQGMKA